MFSPMVQKRPTRQLLHQCPFILSILWLKNIIPHDNHSNAQVPRAPALALHWLAIDGVQPLVPQNPPPVSVPEAPSPVSL